MIQRHPDRGRPQFADGVGGQDRTAQQRGASASSFGCHTDHSPAMNSRVPSWGDMKNGSSSVCPLNRGRSSTSYQPSIGTRQRYDLTDDRNELFCAAVSARALNSNGPFARFLRPRRHQTPAHRPDPHCGSSSGILVVVPFDHRHHHGGGDVRRLTPARSWSPQPVRNRRTEGRAVADPRSRPRASPDRWSPHNVRTSTLVSGHSEQTPQIAVGVMSLGPCRRRKVEAVSVSHDAPRHLPKCRR